MADHSNKATVHRTGLRTVAIYGGCLLALATLVAILLFADWLRIYKSPEYERVVGLVGSDVMMTGPPSLQEIFKSPLPMRAHLDRVGIRLNDKPGLWEIYVVVSVRPPQDAATIPIGATYGNMWTSFSLDELKQIRELPPAQH